MCVQCAQLSYTQNTAQNSSDNFPSYPPDNPRRIVWRIRCCLLEGRGRGDGPDVPRRHQRYVSIDSESELTSTSHTHSAPTLYGPVFVWRNCIRHVYEALSFLDKKIKAFPYSIPSVGPGADPGVQAVSPQVTVGHPPGGRLPLLCARPAVTSPAAEHHRRLAGTKLYCLATEAHRCKQLAQGCSAALPRVGFEPATY